ncbi:GNAT family N-acetyltransferase [Streptococcus ovis]|uniref:GNAT family N-acetyltransferase n=1 Tax=Streptococcus ovis TaxID=82806 RepID=UPI000379D03F|nr:GNAT family N-acetyltransferase [Streptococcus ovis]
MKVELVEASIEKQDIAYQLIQTFWKEHNDVLLTDDEALLDYQNWTKTGHELWLVRFAGDYIGFAHLGSRGQNIDWLEDLFILPPFQNQGIGSQVIALIEERVQQYSESLYIEVAARNLKALKLYEKLGFNCFNTLTIRKDFDEAAFEAVSEEVIAGFPFEIRKRK